MRQFWVKVLGLLLPLGLWALPAGNAQPRARVPLPTHPDVRIKDITELAGARNNQLIGVGLVAGLELTGGRSASTRSTAIDMLNRFRQVNKLTLVNRLDSVFNSNNISVVMVTATLGPFARCGSQIDVTVSILDDATSLKGATLLLTPLVGADSVVYAVAQGPVSVGGFRFAIPGTALTGSAEVQLNHPSVGLIEGGAIVEREARGEILCNGQLQFLLRDPDYATVTEIAKAINARFPGAANALDPGAVQVLVPQEQQGPNLMSFVDAIGRTTVVPDSPAKVIVNERTGTIVAGEDVKIDRVAVAHGNLIITEVRDPFAFFEGEGTELDVVEQKGSLKVVGAANTVGDLARALNLLGATPRDLIIIFQTIEHAGALHAQLIIK